MLKAGTTRIDITPPQGLELSGYPHYPRNNTGMHDPLYAACMYLNNGEDEAVLVSLDLLFYEREYICEIRERVERAVGIKAENITISTSHTHSGPQTYAVTEESPADLREYIAWTIEAIANAIIDAKNNAFDATFTAGTAMCGAESGVGGNRRVRGGPHDPLISIYAVKDLAGDIRGVMTSYSLHPTFIHEWSNVCTADYPCYLKLEIEENFPKALTGFAQGMSGNQSSRYYRNGESYDEAERVGRTLGRAVVNYLKDAKWTDDITIKATSTIIDVDIKEFATEEELEAEVARDRERYEYLYGKYGKSEVREEYYLWQNANLKLLGSENQLNAFRVMKNDPGLIDNLRKAEIHALRLGDACIVGLPGEVFVEYGLYIKACAGFDMVTVCNCTNGRLPGYLYTPQALVTGGYEIGTSYIHPKFGRKLVNAALELTWTLK